MIGTAAKRLAAALTLAAAPSAAPAAGCDLELVLAMDVSRSVSAVEFRQQVDGLAAAFRDPLVAEAVGYLPEGVMATVFIWGDADQQSQSTPWTLLRTPEDLEGFAASIEKTRRLFGFTLTGLGAAMAYADRLHETNPLTCRRRVIDISGDGVWNHGLRPRVIWETQMSRDVTVNGLVIRGATPDPVRFYEQEVIGGPFAFVEVAEDFDHYREAILRKLLRELAPNLSEAGP